MVLLGVVIHRILFRYKPVENKWFHQSQSDRSTRNHSKIRNCHIQSAHTLHLEKVGHTQVPIQMALQVVAVRCVGAASWTVEHYALLINPIRILFTGLFSAYELNGLVLSSASFQSLDLQC